MLSLEDTSVMEDFANAEVKHPTPRKVVDESRTVFLSKTSRRPAKDKGYGLPILCDFGEARIGICQNSGSFVQPHLYRAPEVIFEMPWGPPIDIWNLACVVRRPSDLISSS